MGGSHPRMGGAIHRDSWDNKGGHWPLFRGANGRTMHTNPLSKGEPIGWGPIKAHCTVMDSVAASRRLNNSESPLVYTYPKNTRNSDHGLSFPPQKLRPWSEFLLSPINTESGVV